MNCCRLLVRNISHCQSTRTHAPTHTHTRARAVERVSNGNENHFSEDMQGFAASDESRFSHRVTLQSHKQLACLLFLSNPEPFRGVFREWRGRDLRSTARAAWQTDCVRAHNDCSDAIRAACLLSRWRHDGNANTPPFRLMNEWMK